MKKYFKCKLLTDIVINASLATEGNMKTLDYIPGSNFLGIVAGNGNYKSLQSKSCAYDIFHSGKVSFGDAHIAKSDKDDKTKYYQSYAMPFTLFTDKLDTEVQGENAKVWVHDVLEKNNLRPETKASKEKAKTAKEKGEKHYPEYIQLKQQRSGYLNSNRDFIAKVKKRFALKSAQDREIRKSRDSAMYGFESMEAGQEFIFSVETENQNYLNEVTTALTALKGKRRLGKSKSAQYGQVHISAIDDPEIFSDEACTDNRLLIYAESNLSFLNEYGQTTFQPSPEDFGLTDADGHFNWAASQIRTYSYSPWNAHRNTTDPQRDVILKGSVLVFDFEEGKARKPATNSVGGFQAEGLGRVLYNPAFLKGESKEGLWTFKLKEKPDPSLYVEIVPEKEEEKYGSDLGKFALRKYIVTEKELETGKAILNFMRTYAPEADGAKSFFKNIPTSQWGSIRSKAQEARDFDDLYKNLFEDKEGALRNGVAADRYWNKVGGKPREILETYLTKNKKMGIPFVTKLAAEMAAWKQRFDKKQKTVNA